MTFFTTSELLAITVTHVQPSTHRQRAPIDYTIIMGGTGDRHDVRFRNYETIKHYVSQYDYVTTIDIGFYEHVVAIESKV